MREKMYKGLRVPIVGNSCTGSNNCNCECCDCLFYRRNFELHVEWYNSQPKVKRITKAEAFDVWSNLLYGRMKYIIAELENHYGQKVEIVDEVK